MAPTFEEYQGARADGGKSPGAAFQANLRSKLNLRCRGEGKPAAERIWETDALEV